MSKLFVYPIQLTFQDVSNVRVPIMQRFMNWDTVEEYQREVGHRYERKVERSITTVHVVAADRGAALKEAGQLGWLKNVPVVGSRLVSVQVDEPLKVTMAEWMTRRGVGRHN